MRWRNCWRTWVMVTMWLAPYSWNVAPCIALLGLWLKHRLARQNLSNGIAAMSASGSGPAASAPGSIGYAELIAEAMRSVRFETLVRPCPARVSRGVRPCGELGRPCSQVRNSHADASQHLFARCPVPIGALPSCNSAVWRCVALSRTQIAELTGAGPRTSTSLTIIGNPFLRSRVLAPTREIRKIR